MGKKGGALTSIFSRPRISVDGAASPPWPWPSCRDPRTASFRADHDGPCSTTGGGGRCGPVAARHRRLAAGEMYKTVNSVYLDPNDDGDRSSCLGEEEAVEDDGFSTTTAASEDWSEAVIRSLSRTTSSTDRFFFDQGPATNSILVAPGSASPPPPAVAPEEEDRAAAAALSGIEKLLDPSPPHYSSSRNKRSLAEESVAVAVDSADPYGDFRASMEEMVTAHGLRLCGSWDELEELLAWYLRVNAKRNHPLIVGAFVDLLISLATSPPSTTTTTATTTSNSSTTSTSSSSASTGSTKSTSTASTSTAASAAAMEQCGGGATATELACASCSSCSCAAPTEQDEAAGRGED